LAAFSAPRTGPEVTVAVRPPLAEALVVDVPVVVVASALLVLVAVCEAEARPAVEVLELELLPHAETPPENTIAATSARPDDESRPLMTYIVRSLDPGRAAAASGSCRSAGAFR
jgi:hypothetical protein